MTKANAKQDAFGKKDTTGFLKILKNSMKKLEKCSATLNQRRLQKSD